MTPEERVQARRALIEAEMQGRPLTVDEKRLVARWFQFLENQEAEPPPPIIPIESELLSQVKRPVLKVTRRCERCGLALSIFRGRIPEHRCYDPAADWPAWGLLDASDSGGPSRYLSTPDTERAVAQAVDQVDEIYDLAILEELMWALAGGARRCKSCGGRHTFFGKFIHNSGCTLDHSLTPSERWALRNPERAQAIHARSTRKTLIKRRWAYLQGRCSICTREPARPGLRTCAGCAERGAQRYRDNYAKAAA